ncbi:hypothetical protein NLG97_g4170 [Lecanicillium saksenae]|uniref:Uncharacterized protein n=1 Tax=Lecanicillium saksenae TaxID=468837 RepID=A0ACC1QXT4_9HYPO|nr:hypothetical protein NLG97_g4170 [Lecanicillium saksenae]
MVYSKLLAVVPIIGAAFAEHPAGKRGLASNDGLDLRGFEDVAFYGRSKVRWQYNWDSDIGSNKISFAEYVPMLHSLHDGHQWVWRDRVDKWLNQGTGHLLGFNEPEQSGQARMSVGEAVDAWREWMEPYAPRARLGAPAVSNDGWDWITQFLNQCQGCHIDFIPIHWYNPDSLEWDFENWVNRICSLGKPVWITEFKGLNGSNEDDLAFLKKAMDFLEGNGCVERYAYFGSANNDQSLLDPGVVHLSELGIHYAID